MKLHGYSYKVKHIMMIMSQVITVTVILNISLFLIRHVRQQSLSVEALLIAALSYLNRVSLKNFLTELLLDTVYNEHEN